MTFRARRTGAGKRGRGLSRRPDGFMAVAGLGGGCNGPGAPGVLGSRACRPGVAAVIQPGALHGAISKAQVVWPPPRLDTTFGAVGCVGVDRPPGRTSGWI